MTGWRRWAQVALASALINTSYGTMSYAFSVLVTDQAAGGDLGRSAVATGFGLAVLVSGIASLGVGTLTDLFGSRIVLGAGAVAGAASLTLLGVCQEPWQAMLVLALVMGPAMAATFYEPVYVLMNRWFAEHERPKAYGILTLMSGVSITIYTPLTQWFVEWFGWRGAVTGLAIILLVVGLAVAALVREPRVEARRTAGRLTAREFFGETAAGMRNTNATFWTFSIIFFASTVAFSGFAFHMIAQLETRGFDPGPVATAIAMTGLVSLPARFALPALSGRLGSNTMLGICLAMLGVAAWIASGASAWWEVWLYVAVFGLVFGAVYPLRALVISERFAGPYFGRVIGIQALLVAAARALGPAMFGWTGTDTDSYRLAFQVAAIVLLAGGLTTVILMRHQRPRPVNVAAVDGP